MMEEYDQNLEKEFPDQKPAFATEPFHDSNIIEAKMVGEDYIIILDNKDSFTDVDKITLKQAEIIKMEKNIPNGCWLYEEIYKHQNQYEIHILIEKNGLQDLIIRCEDVILHTQSNP